MIVNATDLTNVALREQEILGQPPRFAPVDRVSVAAEVQAITARLRGTIVGDSVAIPLDAIPEIMFTLCRFPDLWDSILDMSLLLQGAKASLPARTRQLAILRTAWLLQAPYEWGEHVRHSRRAGLSTEEIERVTKGSDASAWDVHDRAVLGACEELRTNVTLSDDTWLRLSERLDDRQRFELIVLIGQFTSIAYMHNALRLRLEPSNDGLSAR